MGSQLNLITFHSFFSFFPTGTYTRATDSKTLWREEEEYEEDEAMVVKRLALLSRETEKQKLSTRHKLLIRMTPFCRDPETRTAALGPYTNIA